MSQAFTASSIRFAPILAAVLLVGGCGEGSGAEDSIVAPSAQMGASAPVDTEEQALQTLARAVAIALEDRDLRMRVLNDLRASRHTVEHKIELRSYLRGRSGERILAKLAVVTGRGPDEVLALVGSVRPLEFYMPVELHRARWKGGEDLVVAALLEDQTTPVGYSLDGERVALSATQAPSVPTLALVPVETDFSAPLDQVSYTNRSAEGGAIGTLRRSARPALNMILDPYDPTPAPYVPPQATGVVMTALSIPDTREGWLKGAPEIEIHSFVSLDGSQNASRLQCSGETASGFYHFNYDGGAYTTTGDALLSLDQVAQANGQRMEFYVYEDDYKPCEIWTDANPFQDMAYAAGAFGVGYGFKVLANSGCGGGCGLLALLIGGYGTSHFIFQGLAGNDDYIGGVSDYRPEGTQSRRILKGGGSTGSITIVYRSS